MTKYSGQTFENEQVTLDGNQFDGCVFVGCDLRFAAGAATTLVGCTFDGCTWVAEGAAALTLQYLSKLYNGLGAHGITLVEMTFNSIRTAQLLVRDGRDQDILPVPEAANVNAVRSLPQRGENASPIAVEVLGSGTTINIQAAPSFTQSFQNINIQVVAGNLASLKSFLADGGISDADLDDLDSVLEQSSPSDLANERSALRTWIDKAAKSVAGGAKEVAKTATRELVTLAFRQYFGS